MIDRSYGGEEPVAEFHESHSLFLLPPFPYVIDIVLLFTGRPPGGITKKLGTKKKHPWSRQSTQHTLPTAAALGDKKIEERTPLRYHQNQVQKIYKKTPRKKALG